MLTLFLSCIPSNVVATEKSGATGQTASLRVETAYADIGEQVEVNVWISDNPGIAGATLSVSYHQHLTLIGAESGEVFSSLDFSGNEVTSFLNPCKFSWDSESGEAEGDGIILTLTFAVSEQAVCNSNLDIAVSYREGDIYGEEEDIALTITNGYVTVIDYMPGDLFEDRVINTKDVRLIRQLINGNCTMEVNEAAADVNADGVINTKDTRLIRRFINGYPGTVLLPSPVKCSHTMEHTPYKAPTCTEEGNVAYWYCSTCKKYFNDEVGTAELTEEQLVIPLGDHTYSTEWSYDATYHWHGATCEHTDSVSDRAEHSFDSDKSCTVCGYSSAEDPTKPYTITYKLVEYNQLQGDTYLLTLSIDNSMNPTGFSSTKEEPLYHPTCGGAYRFCGWYTALVGGELVEKIPVGTTKDVTLYARWEENVFDITYRVSDTPVDPVSPESEAQYLTYRPSKGLADLPSRDPDNYIFLGWYKEDGTKVNSIPVGSTDK